MENNVNNPVKKRKRVSSAYAEAYFDDDYCDYKVTSTDEINVKAKHNNEDDNTSDKEWVSPSDLLIAILDLKPPFTSKITRGTTHNGILAIGGEVLSNERARFVKRLTKLLHENDAAWTHIKEHEIADVSKKVKQIYANIFKQKKSIMTKELSIFYEYSLAELEKSLKAQVDKVLISTHAEIINKLNIDIKEKLKIERNLLEDTLQKRYESEIFKIKKYYKLLLSNELARNNSLIDKAIVERNDALKSFYRQVESENITSTMYVMCTERKKCRIKQFIMENSQTLELDDMYKDIRERQRILASFKDQEVNISHINKEWEDKIKKVLQLFLKFISFSLKLLPEQASFLLDFEKMVVLQLNEFQKNPNQNTSILFNTENINNIFKFEENSKKPEKCTKEPFEIIGDLSDPLPTPYGSRETLPSRVDLPSVRLERQFVYAKCHKYEEIKAIFEATRCKCSDILRPNKQESPSVSTEPEKLYPKASKSIQSESSLEPLVLEDIHRLDECPVTGCKDWAKRTTFPYLNNYLDFDDEKYERVTAILGKLPKRGHTPDLVDPKTIAYRELPFSVTKEPTRTEETQYSSQEDLYMPDIQCTCNENFIPVQRESSHKFKERPSRVLNEVLDKRKTSLRRLLQQNPNLLKMFTDESFDYQY